VKGRSCLQVAANNGNLPLVQYLIDRGADVNFPASDDGGLTTLQGAAQGGYTEVVDYLIDSGVDVRAAPAKNRGVTALEAAAWPICDGDNYEEIDGVYWRFKGKEGELVSTFKSLLALGAPVNRTNSTSGTVLHSLLRRSRIECVKLALQAGAQIEDREPSRPMSTPLQVAVVEGEMEAIQLLLEHGADVNAPAGAEFGRTTLQAATSAEDPDPDIDLLLFHGADVNAPPATRGGVTALQGAAIRGDFRIVRMLLAHEADVNAAPAQEEGRTAVEGAAEHGRLDMMRLLLSVGAKADPVLGFLRAIELAEKNGHLALADLLREYEIATRLCDTMTESPAQPWLTQGTVYDEGLELSI
jgi:ankyrin repeat protein